MKKIVLAILTIASIILLTVGCSNQTTVDPNSNGTESPSNNSSTADVKYEKLIPDPNKIFTDGKISIIDADGGKAYSFRVTGYKDGEYESYVSECKKMGFDNIHSETENDGGKMFMAYTSEKEYYLQVFLGNQINAIDISCKKVTDNN